MKQLCLGPCGREVEQVNSAGLCARCQQERANEQKPDEVRMCKHGCGKPMHRGKCRKPHTESIPKRTYTRSSVMRPAIETDMSRMIKLRERYQEEYDRAEHALAVLKVKLEAADEFIEVLK